jgi:hypothetical protein
MEGKTEKRKKYAQCSEVKAPIPPSFFWLFWFVLFFIDFFALCNGRYETTFHGFRPQVGQEGETQNKTKKKRRGLSWM